MPSMPQITSRDESVGCCEWARFLPIATVILLLATWFATSEIVSRVKADTPLAAADEWANLFDGESYDGWKINENEESWKIEDGAFVANGNRSHLFYVGELQPIKNFELKVDVMTRKGSNGGIYFHTRFQDSGWPSKGYECQVNNTQGDPQKTGGLYNTVRVLEAPAEDDEWFTQHIKVEGNHIVVKINDKVVVDYEQPEDKEGDVKLSVGTFAFQAHDPGSTVYFKNIRLRKLDD